MDDLRHIFPLFIPLVAIIMGIGAGIVAMMIDFRKKAHLLELNHKERLLAIERGIDVPPLPEAFFNGAQRYRLRTPADDLRRGLVLLLLGLAIGFALLLNHDFATAAWGGVPMAIGAAYLIYWAIESRRTPA